MEGYSGSDISTVIRDVLMAPVRTALRSTHFKKVMNPNKGKGPDILFTPCDPNDLGAIPVNNNISSK
jgi:vacuolar protein-sorting-associated protein 4